MMANQDNDNLLALIDAFEESYEKKIDCAIGYEVLPILLEALYAKADENYEGISQ